MYAIIDADGYFGDVATIYSVHADLTAALRARYTGGKSVRLVSGVEGKEAGDKIARGPLDALLNRGDWAVVEVKA